MKTVMGAIGLLLSAFQSAVAQGNDCHGCQQFLVTYDDAAGYLGHLRLPGVDVDFTPGQGSGSGTCAGEPSCEGTSCTYFKGTVTITNTGVGDGIDVFDEGGSGDPRAVLKVGQSSDFPVRGGAGGEMIVCGTNRDIMSLVCHYPMENGPPIINEHTETYKVALRCTPCPGSDPY